MLRARKARPQGIPSHHRLVFYRLGLQSILMGCCTSDDGLSMNHQQLCPSVDRQRALEYLYRSIAPETRRPPARPLVLCQSVSDWSCTVEPSSFQKTLFCLSTSFFFSLNAKTRNLLSFDSRPSEWHSTSDFFTREED